MRELVAQLLGMNANVAQLGKGYSSQFFSSWLAEKRALAGVFIPASSVPFLQRLNTDGIVGFHFSSLTPQDYWPATLGSERARTSSTSRCRPLRIESGCETARSLDFSLYDSIAACARVWFVGSSLITLKLVSAMLSFLFEPAQCSAPLNR